VTRKTIFKPFATAMFCRMLAIVRFDRSTIAASSRRTERPALRNSARLRCPQKSQQGA
jgi:hypothetical protein